MKICPKCGSFKVIYFDSNNDMCEDCKEWFPALKNIKEPKFNASDLIEFAKFCDCDEKYVEKRLRTWITGSDKSELPKSEIEEREKKWKDIQAYMAYRRQKNKK